MDTSNQPEDLASNTRLDLGGWISGPCMDLPLPPVRQIPPGSTAARELLATIAQTLQLATPATTKDELTYLRISRDRARLVMFTCRRILGDREADDTDVMFAVTQLREQAGQLPADQYAANPLES